MFTIQRALQWWSRESASQPVLSVDGQPCTFGELHAWSGRVGRWLQDVGVRPGDRVGMIGTNALPYAVLAMGLMRAGAIGVPLSFRSTASEVAQALAEFTPSLMFTDADRSETARQALGPDANARLHSFDAVMPLRSGAPVQPDFEPEPDTPIFIIGTSGSTGRPKGVVHTHRGVMTYAAEFALMEPRCARGSSVLSLGPFSSSSGYLLLMQFSAMGATLHIESQFRPERALALLTQQRIATFQGAPIFFERIAALPQFQDADLSALHWAHVAGARVDPGLLQAWRDRGVTLRHAYGSTEAGGGWGARDDTAIDAPAQCGRGGMFTAYRIVNEAGAPVAPGTPGEIVVRSACLTAGYWNDPTATDAAYQPDGFHTGDQGMLDTQGNLTYLDRLKDIIISGGLNISAVEVERVVREVDGVDEVAVIAASDAQFGETPLAIVHGDATRICVQALIEHCNRHLANYKVPRYVVIEPDPLPRLPSGKISKPALRQRYRNASTHLPKVR